jgi:hypothetical protein
LKNSLRSPAYELNDYLTLSFDRRVNINSTLQLLRPVVLNDKYLYGFEKGVSGKIKCFDLVNETHVYDINFQDSVLITEGISSFYAHSTDSFFIQASNLRKVYLLDSLGNTLNQWEIHFNIPYILTAFLPEHRPVFEEKTNRLYSTILPVGFLKNIEPENTPLQMAFDVVNDTIIHLFGPVEGVMKFRQDGYYPPDISVPYLLKVDNNLLVSYPMDHFIYVYSNTDGTLKYKKLASSNAVRELPLPLSPDDSKSSQKIWNFRIQTPFYEPLFYHQAENVYTRAIHHPQKLKLADGTLNDDRFRATTVVLLDAELNIIGETYFDDGTYPTHGAVPLTDGLLMYPKDSGFPILKYSFRRK